MKITWGQVWTVCGMLECGSTRALSANGPYFCEGLGVNWHKSLIFLFYLAGKSLSGTVTFSRAVSLGLAQRALSPQEDSRSDDLRAVFTLHTCTSVR